ncbi:TPA: Abi family protein [Streptococcus pneumoniae]
MQKPFKTIPEQIELLHKRGLIITDYKRAKKYLLTNNYYSIINGYSKYFEQSPNKYRPGTNFSEITYSYFYDKEIKYSFLKAILEAEKHIKSAIAYVFSERFASTPYFYLDINNYNKSNSDNIRKIKFVIRQMVKIIDKHKSSRQANSIQHYFSKHLEIPFWVIIDYLTFGDMLAILQTLPISLQDKISKKFYSFICEHIKININFTPAILVSFVENIGEVRNVCAHDNRLFSFKCKKSVKYYSDLHSNYGISNSCAKSSPYHVFIVLQCFLSSIEYAKLHNTLLSRFKTFEKHLLTVSIDKFLTELGFPANWHRTMPKLPQ